MTESMTMTVIGRNFHEFNLEFSKTLLVTIGFLDADVN